MAVFTMKVAGATAEVHSLFDSTRDYCKSYLTEVAPEFTITVTPEDLAFEQADLLAEAKAEGMKPRKFTDPFLDRAAIQRKFADFLLNRNILLFHGSTVALDGFAYLFTAKCGTGKSTHTRLWRQVFPTAQMVNDDKPFLTLTPHGVVAHGSPWSGKHGLANNVCAPLMGICLLRRGEENQICPGDTELLKAALYDQAHSPLDGSLAEKAKSLVDVLVSQVPVWEMACNKELEAAEVAAKAMHH